MMIGVIVAMQKEFDCISGLVQIKSSSIINNREFFYGTLPGSDNYIVCAVSGIGKVNAAVTAMTMIKGYQIDYIISTGCCGGLNPDSQKVGDILVGTSYRYHDVYCGSMSEYGQIPGKPQWYDINPELLDQFRFVNEKYMNRLHYGMMVTGDRFIDTEASRLEIKNHFPIAEGCEMESTAIAQVCFEFNKPFAAFRVISDVPGGDSAADHMKKYDNFWDTMANSSYEFTKDYLCSFPKCHHSLKEISNATVNS